MTLDQTIEKQLHRIDFLRDNLTEVLATKAMQGTHYNLLLLARVLVDEWAAPLVRREVGSYETMLVAVGDGFKKNTHPTVSRYVSDGQYSQLFDAISNGNKFDIVDLFLQREIRSREDATNRIPAFLDELPRMSSIPQYLYFRHYDTFRKLISIERLPAHQEVIDLLVFSEENFLAGRRELNFELFGLERLLPYTLPIDGYGIFTYEPPNIMSNHHVHHFLTDEFVRGLAIEIQRLGIAGNMVEIAAGQGKLSYWLNKCGISIKATDEQPRSDFVEEMNCDETLRTYKPEFVLTSWLPAYGLAVNPLLLDTPVLQRIHENQPNLQKRIIEDPSVRFYISIDPHAAQGDWSGREATAFRISNISGLERHSIGADILRQHRDWPNYSGILAEFKTNPDARLSSKKSVYLFERK